ncbi:hypothetical protein BU17DRAFT_66996 [Hysterangium stoloniferum]|nr:hypothetical protein BU17DRAFT_66996 [Hysterangium stoloniferum]
MPSWGFGFPVWNACARPRRQSTPLTLALHHDGITYFLVLAGLRAFNTFMTVFARFFIVGVCVSWPVSAIALSRCILKLRKLEKADRDDDTCVDDSKASYAPFELEPLDISPTINAESFTSYVGDWSELRSRIEGKLNNPTHDD